MTKFSELNLNPKVLKAVEDAGYETPTPIQEGAIPPALEGRDVLGIAQTGTGKTAGFTLPMLSLLARGRARARMPRSLVLCPTRELAAQVAENFDTYSKNLKLTKALLIGGVSFKEQEQIIDKGVDVLIATPGRLLDHFERGKLILSDVKIMVVDEADRMLDMGFIPDIERIFGLTPFTRQTLFFSATMAPEIERITNTFLQNPARIEVARQATASETIAQNVVMFKFSRRDRADSEKRTVLRKLIDNEGEALTNAIIFCNRKTDVDICAKSLKKYGYDAAAIHGDLDQSQRTRTLEAFRNNELRLLVASDVAARGLDIPSVSHVFNFDVPGHAEDYVHRIGRTGRAGRDGKAITICSPRDDKSFAAVEALIQKTIARLDNPVPTGGETADAPADKPKRTRTQTRAQTQTQTRTRARKRDEDRHDGDRQDTERQDADRREKRQHEDQSRDDDVSASSKPDPVKTEEPPRKSGRSRRGGDKRDGSGVLGMGDHMPSFIAKSFDDRRAS